MSPSGYVLPEGQTIQPHTVTAGQIVTKIRLSVLALADVTHFQQSSFLANT
jgi:hypothetical protein